MRITQTVSIIVLGLILLFLGCHRAALAYVLHRSSDDVILLPPLRSASDSQTTSVAITGARQEAPKQDCDIAGDLISLHWQERTAQISFHAQEFFASSSESPNQVGRGMYLDPLLAIDKFRLDLAERQSKGCLRPIETERLRRAIVEDLPLPPAVAYVVQLGSYDVAGYFDLTTDFRMQITSPIYPPGIQPSVKALLGYETANYAFVAENERVDGRTRLQLASASEVLIGGTPTEKQTLRNEMPFSRSPSYFRLVFMADEGSSDRITRAIFLSTTDESQLAKAVPRHGGNPDDFCAKLTVSGVNCTVIPKNYGVSPELRVRVNQNDAFVRVGGMLQEVLDLPGADANPPPSLRILRPFHGRLIPIKFDRSKRDILKLVLLPGDEVTF